MHTRWLLPATATVAALLSCGPEATRTPPPAGPTSQPSATPTASASAAEPARLPAPKTITIGSLEVRRSTVEPALGAYTLKREELSNLASMQKALGKRLPPAALDRLDQEGFVLLPWQPPKYDPDVSHDSRFGGRIDDMVDLLGQASGPYDPAGRKPEHAVFISADILLHAFHVLVDRNYQRIEERELHPRLRQMAQQLFSVAAPSARQAPSDATEQSLERVRAYLLVALALLEAAPLKPQEPQPVWMDEAGEDEAPRASAAPEADAPERILRALSKYQQRVAPRAFAAAQAELKLIMAARGPSRSPMWREVSTRIVDYTQFTPRSHYTRSAILRSYFRTMMWYGLMHFALESPELTRDALTLTRLLATAGTGEKTPQSLWQAVFEPTAFFVGLSDDATFKDYRTVAATIFGPQPASWDLASDQKLEAFCQQAARQLPQPRIRSAAFQFGPQANRWRSCAPGERGLRLMGQRFIPDSYFFTRLTSGTDLPSTPTALMVMSILGSQSADTLLDAWIASHAARTGPKVRTVLGGLRRELGQLDQQTWGSTLYYGWLYALRPLLQSFGDGYPMFMRTDAWEKKSLLAALGSWTELRHDTLLYAKQSGAEKNGGGAEPEIPPVPKGYVEPNLELLARLAALARMTRDGLSRRGLLDERHREPFDVLERILEFCTTTAEKELANQPITDDEYEQLRTLHLDLRWALSPIDADIITERDARAAVIADVHTDGMAGQILYEATGAPMQILVAVKDRGGVRVTRGAVYSYYEFTAPIGSRLTDEQWHERVYGAGPPLPAPPAWVKQLTGR